LAAVFRSSFSDGRRSAARLLDLLLNLQPCVADVAQAVLRIFLEASAQQALDARRHTLREFRPVGFALEDSRKEIRAGLSDKCLTSRQRFVQHTPEGPDIGAFVHWASARLFRAHIRERAQNDALLCLTDREGL